MLTRPSTATYFLFRLRLHKKYARVGGVIGVEMEKDEHIQNELKRLRTLRLVCHGPFMAIIIVAALNFIAPASLKPIANSIAYICAIWFFVTFFFSFKVNSFTCPNCQQKFHVKVSSNGWHALNLLTRRCVNCGLMLNGSNTQQYL